ncbi:flavodoxin, partial [Dialister hominis]|uniref:flavodoxin n=1 Tax=Dialister hominis TaxID=2582419 RepID=UPI003FD8B884
TSRELNWMDKKSRASLEAADEDCRPAIEGGAFNLSGYDRVYIGFPIWWYTAPRVIQSFIETNDLSGKEIYLFATSGGSDAAKALSDMKKLYPTLSFMGASLLNGPVTKDIGG